MPLLHHPVAGPLGGDRQAVELARQADGEVADVDHLLDLAQALGADLAGLDGDQRAEVGLVLAQQLAELTHELAADRRRHVAPGAERLVRVTDDGGNLVGGVGVHAAQLAAGDGGAGDQLAVVRQLVDTEAREDRGSLGDEGVVRGDGHRHSLGA